MRASVHAAMNGETASVSSVPPVTIDVGESKTRRVSWTYDPRFITIVAFCFGFHVFLVFMLASRVEVTPIEEATPVEVIIEQPPDGEAPEPAKAEEPPPEKRTQPPVEPPSTDFARTAKQDREDGKASDEPPLETSEQKATPLEERAAVEPEAPAPLPPSEQLPSEKSELQFSGFTPLPAFRFREPLARRGEFPSGKAEPGYLSTLYGLIMRKMPLVPKQSRPTRGRVTFGVLGNGSIVQEAVEIPSGVPVLDAAALAAVRRAAPFPAPPRGELIYIRFEYGAE